MTPESERLSIPARLMPTVQRLRKANEHYLSAASMDRHLRELAEQPQSVDPPTRLQRGVSVSASEKHGWRLYTITPTDFSPSGTVIYLHGGGWIHQAVRTHWNWVQQMTLEARTTVIMPTYPLAHEGGTAAQVLPVVAELSGQAVGPVVLMGDSAGGTIAVSATLLLTQRGTPPAMSVLISPALDLRLTNPEIDSVQARDPWLAKPGLTRVLEMWAGEQLEDPILNPIKGDLRGLPPLMIFSGTRDILNPDTRAFAKRARSAGVEVSYSELAGHIHAYPLLPTPEGRRARNEIILSLRKIIEGRGHPFSRAPRIGRHTRPVKDAIRAAEAVLPRSGSVDEMLTLLSQKRGRPISFLASDLDQAISGVLISTAQADYIAIDRSASPERRAVIVCHEVAHAILGHDHSKPLSRSLIDSGILSGIDEKLARSVVAARWVYMDPDEVDAEIVATHLARELRRRDLRGGDSFYEDRWR